jgi:hypothetical protein
MALKRIVSLRTIAGIEMRLDDEYRWFSLSATMPVVSTRAGRAARHILRGVLDRKTEMLITPQAAIAGRLAHPGARARLTRDVAGE